MDRSDDTRRLIERARGGDASAADALLCRHRERLTRMVALRMDRRLRARFDPSDVVQEALLTASRRMETYLRESLLPFYPWLRKIAWEHLVKYHQHHVDAQKRSIQREEPHRPALTDASVHELVERLVGSQTGPSEHVIRSEMRARVHAALEALKPRDREIVELRYLEQLENDEIAAVLGITVPAVRTRHFRAIRRLNQILRTNE